MEISEGYRRARRTASLLSAIGVAWSAAQFDLADAKASPLAFDLSHASVPLVISSGVLYAFARCVIEFVMQPIEVRRWRLAQVDFKLTMLLVRGAILMLGASGLYRSLETLIWVALAVVAFLVASLALRFPSTIILMSVMIRIRARQGSYSVASRAVEAMTWSDAITLGLSVVAALGFGAAAVWYEPFRSLWVIPPPPAAIAGSVVAVVAVVVSYFTEPGFSKKLFAYQDPYAESEPVQDGEDAE